MTEDDNTLLSLIGNPNEMFSPVLNTTPEASGTSPRINPLKRNGGMVYAVQPSPKAMENPTNPTNSNGYVNEI